MRSDSISILAGLLLCSCLLLGDAVMADSITLLSSARRPQEASIITLGDIAKLEGTEAMGWAKLPIVETDDPGDDPIPPEDIHIPGIYVDRVLKHEDMSPANAGGI